MGWGQKTAHRALQAVEFFDNPKKTPDLVRGLIFTVKALETGSLFLLSDR